MPSWRMVFGPSNIRMVETTIENTIQGHKPVLERPMKLDEETKDLIEQSVLSWLATANEAGEPSVSPKELWGLSGKDSIVIAEIASPNSLANIRKQPRVCVSFIEIFKQKGRKLYGNATIVSPVQANSDPIFLACYSSKSIDAT